MSSFKSNYSHQFSFCVDSWRRKHFSTFTTLFSGKLRRCQVSRRPNMTSAYDLQCQAGVVSIQGKSQASLPRSRTHTIHQQANQWNDSSAGWAKSRACPVMGFPVGGNEKGTCSFLIAAIMIICDHKLTWRLAQLCAGFTLFIIGRTVLFLTKNWPKTCHFRIFFE